MEATRERIEKEMRQMQIEISEKERELMGL